ncbi:hypothetical protein RRG08_047284 [Elysia crispata]|uniref:Uncharacterized protein n=1 Tax=Elysia crispata TaxID=231223 RepID=A0AAE0ZD81_9GAST|nr:hypothetical protein RRG08_047284 [Elysia crispata]
MGQTSFILCGCVAILIWSNNLLSSVDCSNAKPRPSDQDKLAYSVNKTTRLHFIAPVVIDPSNFEGAILSVGFRAARDECKAGEALNARAGPDGWFPVSNHLGMNLVFSAHGSLTSPRSYWRGQFKRRGAKISIRSERKEGDVTVIDGFLLYGLEKIDAPLIGANGQVELPRPSFIFQCDAMSGFCATQIGYARFLERNSFFVKKGKRRGARHFIMLKAFLGCWTYGQDQGHLVCPIQDEMNSERTRLGLGLPDTRKRRRSGALVSLSI